MSTRPIPNHLAERFDVISDAIAKRLQLVLDYGGYRREVCPHSIGWKGDHLSCFAWQFGGRSAHGLPPGGQWRCLHVETMRNVTSRPGEWHTGRLDPQTSPCIDDYVAYVGFPIGTGAPLPATEGTIDALISQRIEDAIAPLVRRIEDLEWQLQARSSKEEGDSEF